MTNYYTLIVCTRNRPEYLGQLFASLRTQQGEQKGSNLLLVNNGTKGSVQLQNINITHEPQPGLSHARNTGIEQVTTPWLIFLDDDVQLPPDFLVKAQAIIASDVFDCFGGTYYPWYPTEKPPWLPSSFGKKPPLRATTGPITPGKEGFLSAGIFAVRKQVLEDVGGFRTDLGMGTSIGYGEEDELQLRIHQAGYRIGFVPDWWMHHAVLPHKHRVGWHLQSTYAKARDAERIQRTHRFIPTLLSFLKGVLALLLKRLPVASYRWVSQADYYWQNALLYLLTPLSIYTGKLVATLQR